MRGKQSQFFSKTAVATSAVASKTKLGHVLDFLVNQEVAEGTILAAVVIATSNAALTSGTTAVNAEFFIRLGTTLSSGDVSATGATDYSIGTFASGDDTDDDDTDGAKTGDFKQILIPPGVSARYAQIFYTVGDKFSGTFSAHLGTPENTQTFAKTTTGKATSR